MKVHVRILWLAVICGSMAFASEAQEAGDFKITYGFDFKTTPRHEDQGASAEKGSASFRYYFTSRVSAKIANDNFVSKKPFDGPRITGFGNSKVTLDWDVVLEDPTGVKKHPSFSLEYNAYLPTGSSERGFSTGRVDHEISGAITKSVGESAIVNGAITKRTNLEVDLGGYFAGNPGQHGYTSTGEITLAVTRTLDDLKVGKYTYHGEIDMSSHAKDTLSEIYGLSELRTVLPHHLLLITGVRAGITPNSPKFAAYASITYGGSFRHKKS